MGFLRTLTKSAIGYWQPVTCRVFSLAFDDAIGNAFDARSSTDDFLRIGWLTWFGNPAVQAVIPMDLHVERLGSGLLVMTQPTLRDPGRAEDVDRGRCLVEVLRESGWLKLSRMTREATAGDESG